MKLNNPYITKRTDTLYKLHYKLQKSYERLGKVYYICVTTSTYNYETLLHMINDIEDIIKAIGRISKEIQEEDKTKYESYDTL